VFQLSGKHVKLKKEELENVEGRKEKGRLDFTLGIGSRDLKLGH
jgi:hypothetical protein